MRYGRPLNHMKVQHAELKFFLHCNGELVKADALRNTASKAAADCCTPTGSSLTLFSTFESSGVAFDCAKWHVHMHINNDVDYRHVSEH